MKAIATTTNETEPLPIMRVAVRTITPEVQLYCHQPLGGFPAGTILPVYGGNLKYPSAYVPGHTPPEWRVAVEDGDFGSEVIFRPLPALMQEIVFDEHPGQYEILLPDARVIPIETPAEPEAPTCKVIRHPATYNALVRIEEPATYNAPVRIEEPASKRKPAGRQLFLEFESDEPITQSA